MIVNPAVQRAAERSVATLTGVAPIGCHPSPLPPSGAACSARASYTVARAVSGRRYTRIEPASLAGDAVFGRTAKDEEHIAHRNIVFYNVVKEARMMHSATSLRDDLRPGVVAKP